MNKRITFEINDENAFGKRLDIVLFNLLKEKEINETSKNKDYFSRSRIQGIIKEGNVLLNGKKAKASCVLEEGDKIEVNVDIEKGNENRIAPYEKDINIIYEDDDVLVVNKEANFVVHPGAGNKANTLLNAIVDHLSFKGGNDDKFDPQRLGIVHRIDKDTTGLLVIAKNEFAQTNLMEQFKNHTVGREYIGLCLSTPRADREINKEESGRIETHIGRHPTNRKKMAVLESGGKVAITNWKKIEEMKYATLLSFRLETGRTHQIRVHMEYLNSPLIGDKLYGDFSLLPAKLKVVAQNFARQALHAKSLTFVHPTTKKIMTFDSPLPKDMEAIIEEFRNY